MWQLIKRDAIIQKTFLYVFIPFLVFFIWMDMHPIITFIVASVYIPFNALIYDATASTHVLLNSLPYKRSEIIAARYVGSLLYAALSIIISMGVMYLFSLSYSWDHIFIAVLVVLLIISTMYPFLYLFDGRHLPTIMMIVLMLFLIGSRPLAWLFTNKFTAIYDFITSLSMVTIVSSSAGLAICLFLLSWLFTTKRYEQRSF
ncbi:ABC-2 transporter permease [Paenibacillus yanchengensis]|uniref:ABC-2 transporter permease n=1 Tax=Paenibacillus yanchengensis TaxID=2035833 RepID=A0ABW4YEW6_9BACL